MVSENFFQPLDCKSQNQEVLVQHKIIDENVISAEFRIDYKWFLK